MVTAATHNKYSLDMDGSEHDGQPIDLKFQIGTAGWPSNSTIFKGELFPVMECTPEGLPEAHKSLKELKLIVLNSYKETLLTEDSKLTLLFDSEKPKTMDLVNRLKVVEEIYAKGVYGSNDDEIAILIERSRLHNTLSSFDPKEFIWKSKQYVGVEFSRPDTDRKSRIIVNVDTRIPRFLCAKMNVDNKMLWQSSRSLAGYNINLRKSIIQDEV